MIFEIDLLIYRVFKLSVVADEIQYNILFFLCFINALVSSYVRIFKFCFSNSARTRLCIFFLSSKTRCFSSLLTHDLMKPCDDIRTFFSILIINFISLESYFQRSFQSCAFGSLWYDDEFYYAKKAYIHYSYIMKSFYIDGSLVDCTCQIFAFVTYYKTFYVKLILR